MKNLKIAVAAFIGLTLLATSAQAKAKLGTACKADLAKFCADVKKGDGRKACLRTHAAELEAACTTALQEADAAKAKK